MTCPQFRSVFDDPYELVIHAGCADQKILSRWPTFDEADIAKREQFTDEEREELDVDIMKFGSTEF